MSFRYGIDVANAADLETIDGGLGFTAGKIRITDRSGASAEIDLSAAQNIDDVLAAINNASAINVLATADGDRIRLTDKTGQTGRTSRSARWAWARPRPRWAWRESTSPPTPPTARISCG